jgi:hypothetical protein
MNDYFGLIFLFRSFLMFRNLFDRLLFLKLCKKALDLFINL